MLQELQEKFYAKGIEIPFADAFRFAALSDFTIEAVLIIAPNGTEVPGDYKFNLTIDGAPQTIGGDDRLTVGGGVTLAERTGLSIAVTKGQIIGSDFVSLVGVAATLGTPIYFGLITDNGEAVVIGPGSATANAFALFDGTTGKLIKDSAVLFSTDDTFAANSDALIPSQKAIETRIAAKIAAFIAANDVEVFKGSIDCSANPNYPAADAGHVYRVSVAGKIGGGSGPNVEVNDRLECVVDASAAGNHATVGANWYISQANVDGAVTGPASAVNNSIAVFDLTSGKIIKDGGKTLPSGSVVGTTDAQTLTNKRIGNRIFSEASNATPTPDADAYDGHTITALAAAAAFAAPTGTPVDFDGFVIRIKDNGTARALTWNAIYRGVGAALPSTTILGKTHYVALLWNAAASKWDAWPSVEP